MHKIIAMGADNGYMSKVETTIKSIAAFNDQFKIYIFNDDLPSEWFRVMNQRLKPLDSEVINVKISDNHLRKYNLPTAHLSYAAYFRFFIPDILKEDKVLYLDSDIIVNGDLTPLFAIDLGDSPVAAVRDELQQTNFNSGVLLINNAYWREHSISTKLFELADQYHEVEFGDQGILNRFFVGQWKELDVNYNFMVGMDTIATRFQKDGWYVKANQYESAVSVIHYTDGKPWSAIYKNRLGDRWWFFYALDWSDIILRKEIIRHGLEELTEKEKYHTAIFTNACEMEHLEFLIKALPNVHFHILAHTSFASQVVDLQRYLNVSIYPQFNPYNFENVLSKIDFYLDINHFNEIMNITQEIHNLGKPIFAFDNTSKDPTGGSQIFSSQTPEVMVVAIKAYLNSLDK